MSREYKLWLEASKPYTQDELLLQAEVDDFFEHLEMINCEQIKRKDGMEYVSYVGTTTLGGGLTEKEQHQRILEYLIEASEYPGVKLRTHWLELEHYDETIGEEKP